MPTIRHLVTHVRHYGMRHQPLYAASLMLFFWAIYDSIVSFITPLLITEHQMSRSMMGFILGSSSLFGALFDLLLCRLLPHTHFRRIYLLVFSLCFFYPVLLWKANTIFIFVCAMMVWGLYYDLMNIGNYDLVSRFTPKNEHSSSFGVLQIFKSLGYLIGPLAASIMIGTTVHAGILLYMWIFLSLSALFYLILTMVVHKKTPVLHDKKLHKNRSLIMELKTWRKISRGLLPVLLFITLLNIIDAFFWSIGPLFAESTETNIPAFGGMFMAVYMIPILFIGWFIDPLVAKWGKRKAAYAACGAGAGVLSLIAFVHNPLILLMVIFLASLCISVAWPAMQGLIVDYVTFAPEEEKEIEALADFFTNTGYIIGPVMAGILADLIGNSLTFAALGAGAIVFVFLISQLPLRRVR